MGTFDPATFLDQTVDAPNSTAYVPIPVGEYPAVIEKVDFREWTARDGSSSGIALDIVWNIDDAKVKEELQRDKVQVKQGIMIDLNAAGGIDTGKGRNVKLGKLREAVKQNTGNFSFRNLEGQMAKVVVSHRVDKESSEIFSEVKQVAPL